MFYILLFSVLFYALVFALLATLYSMNLVRMYATGDVEVGPHEKLDEHIKLPLVKLFGRRVAQRLLLVVRRIGKMGAMQQT